MNLIFKGWNIESAAFSQMINDNGLKAVFVSQAVSFLKQNNFDGLDIDWKFPGKAVLS